MNREHHIDRLKTESFDLLVIGGGATGAGTALDAASRGLKVALVERDDFSAGTSSRSTKLIHGGVRYLEQAVKKFDRSQFNLVRDALHERSTLLKLAPHLARPLAILTPLYHRLDVPYYTTGLKIYDWLAGKAQLKPSRFVGRGEAAARFPMLKAEGLRGGVLYYDGQFDDARMNIAIALTAAEEGAVIANHVEVSALAKEGGKVSGAVLCDLLSGETWESAAAVVVNATGPFSDSIRHLDDPEAPALLSASSGVHIVLDAKFSPPDAGLLIPQTEDGRVLFLLPWLGHTLVGTTDNPAAITAHPKAGDADVDYILRHLRKTFDLPVTRDDVRSSWSGLRPLVSDLKAADTARLSRDHIINVSASGLVTIAGGKWTTYRKMALDTVDEAVRVGGLEPVRASRTETIKLSGARGFDPEGDEALKRRFGLKAEVAHYLNRSYGDRATEVAALAGRGYGARLAEGHPYLEAEVLYGVHCEFARTALDVLARRTRLSFLDSRAAHAALPKVLDLLGAELGWDEARKEKERERAQGYLG
ncbi:MAG: FAD-dependent oxidoreductase [Deinococcota bacterium]|jgi:glycerol-3-phosphate dehydrogenase|nr:FAD-dependent oxidoreductase [Deinococcota bacterium]